MRFHASVFISALCVTSTFALPSPVVSRGTDALHPFASSWGTKGNDYPIVMIHGLFGWGEKPLLGFLKYWGGVTSDIVGVLRNKGYTVVAPHMGPVSSNWERACEAYAQIAGTVVDYGVARAAKFGHARFGEDYTKAGPLVPGFMSTPNSKINLIGHSMGGPTSRMLAHLLYYGSQEEVDACNAQPGCVVSPLFATNKTTNYANAVFSVAGVLQGSTFDDILQSNGGITTFLLDLIKLFVGADNLIPGLYDMSLGHWGLNPKDGEDFGVYIKRIFSSPWAGSKSNALFDLSVAGYNDPLLSFMKEAPGTTYFSVAGLSTYDWFGNSYHDGSTNLFLQPTADLIGSYHNSSLIGNDLTYWHPNDGLVPIQSARGSIKGGFVDYSTDLTTWTSWLVGSGATKKAPAKGVYNYVGYLNQKDHIALIALLDLVGGGMDQPFLNMAALMAST
ncbi:hypothetical protein HDU76_001991 [Blyttiomyces sp. JEL0837]|nr:hypothetical protein HDU76_001991 [Blyttiomyces sp. JEL0837]